MQISESIGGITAVSAMIVMLTGAVGYCLGPLLFRIMGVDDPVVRGIAYGTSSHVLGTAKAVEEGELTGPFAALAIAVIGLISALTIPLMFHWFGEVK
jgi:putative effector of murein hydrolase